MSPEDRIEKRLDDLEAVVYGIHGAYGLVGEIHGLRTDFRNWREEQSQRRDADRRIAILSLGSACVALIAVVATLIGVVAL